MSNVHSLYGSLFGIRNADGVPIHKDVASGVQVASDSIGASVVTSVTSTGETLKKYGTSLLAASSAAVHTMPTPNGSGRRVRIVANSASTAQTVNISTANGSFTSTAGTSMYNILFTARGAAVELVDISTVWMCFNHNGSSAAVFSS